MKYLFLLAPLIIGCSERNPGDFSTVKVYPGMHFDAIVDTLVSKNIVESPGLLRLYARITGTDRRIQAGEYALQQHSHWKDALTILTEGNVVTFDLTIPEGLMLQEIAEKISEKSTISKEEIYSHISDPSLHEIWSLPGPGLEGYLFPDTYSFPKGVALETILETMIEEYKSMWTPDRIAKLDDLNMTERELMTLASIIQAEARVVGEMPRISSVYHNRLRLGYLLQADPTVIYALGSRRSRLLFAAIDSVADNPYNTYTQNGLPPGPIAAPGELAIDAALNPSEESYLYFVAHPDGQHIFSETLQEHNRAVQEVRKISSIHP